MKTPTDAPKKPDPRSSKRLGGLFFALRLVRLVLVIFVVMIAAAVGLGAFVWLAKSPALAAYLARTVTRDVFQEGFVCELGDIGGSPFRTIRLSNIRVLSPTGDTLLVAKEIVARYPLARVLRGEIRLTSLHVDAITLTLHELPNGGLVVPWRTRERTRPPSIVARQDGVDALAIDDASIFLETHQGKTVEIARHASLEGVVLTVPDGATMSLVARGQIPVALLTLDRLSAEATLQGNLLNVTSGEAVIGSSRLTGTGRVSVGGPPILHFDVDVPHVETADAWQILDLAEVLGHGFVHGTAQVDRVPLAAKVSWNLAGELNGDVIDHLDGVGLVNNETFRSDYLFLEAEGARATGTLALDIVAPRSYQAVVDVENVDLSDVPIQGKLVELHPHRVNGRITLHGDDYERPFPRMEVTARMGASTYLEVPFDSLRAEISMYPARSGAADSAALSSNLVRVRSAEAWQSGGTWRANGIILPERTCDVWVEATRFPLRAFSPLHHSRDLDARASFVARVTGDVLHPDVTASGALDSLQVGQLRIGDVAVDTLRGVLVPFDAHVTARGRSLRIGAWTADSLAATGNVAATVAVEDLRLWRGDSVFAARGTIVPEGRSARGMVTVFSADLPAVDVALTGPAPLTYAEGGVWRIGPAKLAVAGGALDVEISTEANGARPRIVADGSNVPLLDIVKIAGQDSLRGAPASFHVDYTGDERHPSLFGRAAIGAIRVGAIEAESLAFRFAGAADSLAVRDLVLDLGGEGTIRAGGVLRTETSPVLGLLSPDPMASLFRPTTSVRGSAQGTGLGLDLPGKVRAIMQPYARTEIPDTTQIIVTEVPFDPWLDLLGRARGTLEMDGRLDNPMIRASIEADSVHVRSGLVLDRVDMSALLRDSLLTVSQCDLVVEGRRAQVSGFLPCAVDLSTRRARILDRDMLVSLDMAEMPLGLATLGVPDLIVLRGSVTGSGQIAGRLTRIQPSGSFELKDGEARWFGRTEVLKDASATIELTPDGVVLRDLVASEGQDGRVTGSGVARSPANYRFDFRARNFYFLQGGFTGLVDATIRVSPDSATAGRRLPRVEGDVELKEGEIFQWDVPRPEMSPETITALYDLSIDVGRIHVNTNELHSSTNVLIGNGELTLRNYPESIRLGGSLTVLEGGASVYGNQFRVTRGRLDFVEVDGVNPELDIEAEAPIRGPYARERGFEGYDGRIVATVTGNLRKPVVELSTRPETLQLSQNEILEYLTFGRYIGTGSAASGLDPTADILLGLLAQDLSYLFPYVDYVEIISSEQSRSFHVVKNISDQLSIGYTTGVSSTPDQELSIEARLSRIFALKGGVLRGEVGSAQEVGGRYNLDLRLNIEY